MIAFGVKRPGLAPLGVPAPVFGVPVFGVPVLLAPLSVVPAIEEGAGLALVPLVAVDF